MYVLYQTIMVISSSQTILTLLNIIQPTIFQYLKMHEKKN